MTFEFRKVISSAYPTMWDEFKISIHIIRTSVIKKNVGYSIHALINPQPFCWLVTNLSI